MVNSVARIVEDLKARQRIEGLSDDAFSDKIHISRQMWNFIKLGQREPGETVWQGVVRAYPDLAAAIILAYGNRLVSAGETANGNVQTK